jgi:hypothetical protein
MFIGQIHPKPGYINQVDVHKVRGRSFPTKVPGQISIILRLQKDADAHSRTDLTYKETRALIDVLKEALK